MKISDKKVNKWFIDEAKAEAVREGEDHITTHKGESGGPLTYSIGYCDWKDRKALMLIISAARNLCGMNPATARKALELALSEIAPTRKDLF
jgi:hypothetical protein